MPVLEAPPVRAPALPPLAVRPVSMPPIFITGKPCCGKTTLRKLLDLYYELVGRSCSEVLDPELTPEERRQRDAGKLLSDERVIEIVTRRFLNDPSPRRALDGYPRSEPQSLTLPPGAILIHIEITDKLALRRNGQRSREDRQSFGERMRYFRRATWPMLWKARTRKDIHFIEVAAEETSPEELLAIVTRQINAHLGLAVKG